MYIYEEINQEKESTIPHDHVIRTQYEEKEKTNLLVEEMIVHFQLAVSSKIVWQEHYWNVNVTKFVYLQYSKHNNHRFISRDVKPN